MGGEGRKRDEEEEERDSDSGHNFSFSLGLVPPRKWRRLGKMFFSFLGSILEKTFLAWVLFRAAGIEGIGVKPGYRK